MNKPLNLKAKEFEEQLVKLINESDIPAFILKPIIEKIYKQLEIVEQKQLEIVTKEYNESLKKESDKDGTKQK